MWGGLRKTHTGFSSILRCNLHLKKPHHTNDLQSQNASGLKTPANPSIQIPTRPWRPPHTPLQPSSALLQRTTVGRIFRTLPHGARAEGPQLPHGWRRLQASREIGGKEMGSDRHRCSLFLDVEGWKQRFTMAHRWLPLAAGVVKKCEKLSLSESSLLRRRPVQMARFIVGWLDGPADSFG